VVAIFVLANYSDFYFPTVLYDYFVLSSGKISFYLYMVDSSVGSYRQRLSISMSGMRTLLLVVRDIPTAQRARVF